jgi:putative NADPH-quinone reductase
MTGRKIAILNGHPDDASRGLCHALAEAYAAGAVGRHEVRRLDVGALTFDLLKSQGQFLNEPATGDMAAAQELLRWADHLVVIFPLWLGDMPARLKGFFEQVLRPGFAYTLRPNGFPVMHLKGRSARIVVTMGMPAFVYRWYFFAHGLKNLKRNILAFVGYRPVRTTIVGSLGARSRQSIERQLEEIKALGADAR